MQKILQPIKWAFLISSILLLQGCYTVIISNKNGTATPDITNNAEGFYRNKEVTVIDTTIKLGVLENEVIALEHCPQGFHSVEYRVTLGGILLNAITLGKRKKVQVRYVCIKDSNE